jgi:hypothetical protein
MLAWAALSSWSTHPSYLAYVNESLGGPELAYQSFVDSNVDWGRTCGASRSGPARTASSACTSRTSATSTRGSTG